MKRWPVAAIVRWIGPGAFVISLVGFVLVLAVLLDSPQPFRAQPGEMRALIVTVLTVSLLLSVLSVWLWRAPPPPPPVALPTHSMERAMLPLLPPFIPTPARLRQEQPLTAAFMTEKQPGAGEDAEPILMIHQAGKRGALAVFDGLGGSGGALLLGEDGIERSAAYYAARATRACALDFLTDALERPYETPTALAAAFKRALQVALHQRHTDLSPQPSSSMVRSRMRRACFHLRHRQSLSARLSRMSQTSRRWRPSRWG